MQNRSRLHMQRKQISRNWSISAREMKWVWGKTCIMKNTKGDEDRNDLQISLRCISWIYIVLILHIVHINYRTCLCSFKIRSLLRPGYILLNTSTQAHCVTSTLTWYKIVTLIFLSICLMSSNTYFEIVLYIVIIQENQCEFSMP